MFFYTFYLKALEFDNKSDIFKSMYHSSMQL